MEKIKDSYYLNGKKILPVNAKTTAWAENQARTDEDFKMLELARLEGYYDMADSIHRRINQD